jgi:preprotein translocase subunit SecA
VVLSVLDRKWREHLYEMDYLREGIGLRAMAQRDPLIEYQREGYDLFNTMMEGIKEESVGNLFNLKVEVQQNPIVEEADENGSAAPAAPATGRHAASPGRHARGSAKPAPARGAPTDGPPTGRAANGAPDRPAAGDAEPGPQVVAKGLSRPQRPTRLSYSAPSADGGGQVERRTEAAGADKGAKVGRNAPCPCGSGKKYKVCHGDPRNRANG